MLWLLCSISIGGQWQIYEWIKNVWRIIFKEVLRDRSLLCEIHIFMPLSLYCVFVIALSKWLNVLLPLNKDCKEFDDQICNVRKCKFVYEKVNVQKLCSSQDYICMGFEKVLQHWNQQSWIFVKRCGECFCLNSYRCEVFVMFSTIYAKKTLSSALTMSENCKMNQ